MMQCVLSKADIDRLLLMIDRDPKHGADGGSSDSSVRDVERGRIYDEAHRFYNYQVRKWISEVTGE